MKRARSARSARRLAAPRTRRWLSACPRRAREPARERRTSGRSRNRTRRRRARSRARRRPRTADDALNPLKKSREPPPEAGSRSGSPRLPTPRRRRERFSPRRPGASTRTRARREWTRRKNRRRARRELRAKPPGEAFRGAKRRAKKSSSSSSATRRRTRRRTRRPTRRPTRRIRFRIRIRIRIRIRRLRSPPPRGRRGTAAGVCRAPPLSARGARRGARRTRSDATFFSPIVSSAVPRVARASESPRAPPPPPPARRAPSPRRPTRTTPTPRAQREAPSKS